MRSAWISAACSAATASSKRADNADCSANDQRRATSVSATWCTGCVASGDDGDAFLGASGATNSAPTRTRRSANASAINNAAKTSQNNNSPIAASPVCSDPDPERKPEFEFELDDRCSLGLLAQA